MASIQDFCWPLSAAPRESINFYISAAGNYTVKFVRFANNDPTKATAADICNSEEMSEHLLTDIVLNLSGSPAAEPYARRAVPGLGTLLYLDNPNRLDLRYLCCEMRRWPSIFYIKLHREPRSS